MADAIAPSVNAAAAVSAGHVAADGTVDNGQSAAGQSAASRLGDIATDFAACDQMQQFKALGVAQEVIGAILKKPRTYTKREDIRLFRWLRYDVRVVRVTCTTCARKEFSLSRMIAT